MNQATLKTALYNYMKAAVGVRHVFKITFSADLVAGNVINATFDGEAMDAVTFATSHAGTMEKIADEIHETLECFQATVTAAREITVTGAEFGDEITVLGPTVTGGASQATATVTTVEDPLSVTVIFADQAAPRPPYPYAVIRVDSVVNLGEDELREMDDDGIATIGGQRRATVSISVLGTDALEQARQAHNALEKKTIQQLLSSYGIAIIGKEAVQNLTAVLESKYEQRADFDFFIGFADNVLDDIGIIERVELTGHIEGTRDGNELVLGPETIEV